MIKKQPRCRITSITLPQRVWEGLEKLSILHQESRSRIVSGLIEKELLLTQRVNKKNVSN